MEPYKNIESLSAENDDKNAFREKDQKEAERIKAKARLVHSNLMAQLRQGPQKSGPSSFARPATAEQVALEAEAKTAIERKADESESEDESGFQTAPEDESDESDFETGDIKFKATMRFSVEVNKPNNMYYSNGA